METSRSARPHGRAEVVAALLSAATTLFAERGPGNVSLRDVAAAANVNLGLIHRYIGSKEDLLAAVLASQVAWQVPLGLPAESPAEIVETFLQIGSVEVPYLTVLLRAVLDRYDVGRLQPEFPLLERAARSTRTNLPRRDADVRIALLAAALLGWQAIGPLFLHILKQRNIEPDELAEILRPALVAFVTADPDPSKRHRTGG
jgi:AcrR family transcriptional regulator